MPWFDILPHRKVTDYFSLWGVLTLITADEFDIGSEPAVRFPWQQTTMHLGTHVHDVNQLMEHLLEIELSMGIPVFQANL